MKRKSYTEIIVLFLNIKLICFESLLSLWNDADPGIAELEDARKRLAGLRGSAALTAITTYYLLLGVVGCFNLHSGTR